MHIHEYHYHPDSILKQAFTGGTTVRPHQKIIGIRAFYTNLPGLVKLMMGWAKHPETIPSQFVDAVGAVDALFFESLHSRKDDRAGSETNDIYILNTHPDSHPHTHTHTHTPHTNTQSYTQTCTQTCTHTLHHTDNADNSDIEKSVIDHGEAEMAPNKKKRQRSRTWSAPRRSGRKRTTVSSNMTEGQSKKSRNSGKKRRISPTHASNNSEEPEKPSLTLTIHVNTGQGNQHQTNHGHMKASKEARQLLYNAAKQELKQISFDPRHELGGEATDQLRMTSLSEHGFREICETVAAYVSDNPELFPPELRGKRLALTFSQASFIVSHINSERSTNGCHRFRRNREKKEMVRVIAFTEMTAKPVPTGTSSHTNPEVGEKVPWRSPAAERQITAIHQIIALLPPHHCMIGLLLMVYEGAGLNPLAHYNGSNGDLKASMEYQRKRAQKELREVKCELNTNVIIMGCWYGVLVAFGKDCWTALEKAKAGDAWPGNVWGHKDAIKWSNFVPRTDDENSQALTLSDACSKQSFRKGQITHFDQATRWQGDNATFSITFPVYSAKGYYANTIVSEDVPIDVIEGLIPQYHHQLICNFIGRGKEANQVTAAELQRLLVPPAGDGDLDNNREAQKRILALCMWPAAIIPGCPIVEAASLSVDEYAYVMGYCLHLGPANSSRSEGNVLQLQSATQRKKEKEMLKKKHN